MKKKVIRATIYNNTKGHTVSVWHDAIRPMGNFVKPAVKVEIFYLDFIEYEPTDFDLMINVQWKKELMEYSKMSSIWINVSSVQVIPRRQQNWQSKSITIKDYIYL